MSKKTLSVVAGMDIEQALSKQPLRDDRKVEVAFVMAAAHTGSTLLVYLLGAHPEVTTIGEAVGTRARSDPGYRCSCGLVARACPFWIRVQREMVARGFEFDIADFGTAFRVPRRWATDRLLRMEYRSPIFEAARDALLALSPTWRATFVQAAEQNAALARVVTGLHGARIFVDSSKLPHHLKFLLRVSKLRVKVIHLVRDGRGVCASFIRNYGRTMESAAKELRRETRSSEYLLASLPHDQWTRVRYEDLCGDPRGELQRLCVFLGMNPSLLKLDFRSAGLHVFGNAMRLRTGSEIRADNRWKHELSAEDLRLFDRIAGSLNRKYHYD